MSRNKAPETYDLWGHEDIVGDQPKTARGSRKKRRVQYVHSLLPAVIPPAEGASYNPPMDSYLKYAGKIVATEKQIEAKERRMARKMDVAEGVCPAMLNAEEFFTGKCENELKNESTIKEEDKTAAVGPTKTSKKTRIKKKRKLDQKRLETRQRAEKEGKKQLGQQLNSLKSIKRTVIAELEAHNAKLESKRLKKTLDSVTRRKRLGRGKFEPAQKPILGPSELPYSLRQLDPTAGGESLLLERLKSLQQRNIMPIPGESQARKLKGKLKVKMVEKRSQKDVTASSAVI